MASLNNSLEPKIEDAVVPQSGEETLNAKPKYRIEPPLPHFPECKSASKEQLLEVKRLYSKLDLKAANAAAEKLNIDENDPQSEFALLRLTIWKMKSYFHFGDYKQSMTIAEKLEEAILKKHPGLKSEA